MNNLKFRQERFCNTGKIAENKKLQALAAKLYKEFSEHKYQYGFDWLGLPIIQIPQDIIALQELVWELKPDLIIETGIARGGSLIFYASMLELIGKGKVLGIDIDIRKHNKKEVEKHKMAKRIIMIEGSSLDKHVLNRVSRIAKNIKKVMVCLDSLHTHEHVLRELELYSGFVNKGGYLVVFDTIIEHLPKGFFAGRSWDKGNNPATAVKAFLKQHKNFIVDKNIENKILLTCAPGGFLKRIK